MLKLGCRGLAEHEVVAVDDRFGGRVTEDDGDGGGVLAPDLLEFLAAVVDQTTGNFLALTIAELDGVLGVKVAFDFQNTCGEQRFAAVADGPDGPIVEVEQPRGNDAVGQPALASVEGAGLGFEDGANALAVEHFEDVGGVAAIGDHGADASGGGDPGGGDFGHHAASAPLAARTGDVGLELVNVLDPIDGVGFRVLARIGGVKLIHIGHQKQPIGIDQAGNAGRKRVIVAEFQFFDGDGVIFVDDRHDIQFQQGIKGAKDVDVARSFDQVVAGQQHLGDRLLDEAEHIVVDPHQTALTHGGDGLFERE